MLEQSGVLRNVWAQSSETSDEVLADRASTDGLAFAELYDRYMVSIYQYCRRRSSSIEDAEDLTSTIFTKALSGLSGFRASRGSFRSWLFAIAHHTVVDDIRARRRIELDESRFAGTDLSGPGPESDLAEDEPVRELLALLSGLPPHYARVIELRLAGLTDGEIGHVLGRSRVAIRIVHHRALGRLRALLDPSGGTMQ
jgi:RNA polymerase sigma-70 factor (ECF subfamily)